MNSHTRDRRSLRLLLLLPPIIFGSEFLAMLVLETLPPFGIVGGALADAALLTVISVPAVWVWIVSPLGRALAAECAATAKRADEIRLQAAEQAAETRLARAMHLAESEAEVLDLMRRVLGTTGGGRAAELLVADSSYAHLRKAVEVGPEGRGPACGVATPGRCPAVRGGQTVVYSDSEAIDSCPQLRARAGGPCSAICVPVSIMGRAVGVLHTTGAQHDVPKEHDVRQLEVLATQAGARIGTLRVVETAQLQANTDGLTGLLTAGTRASRSAPPPWPHCP